jgi:hypothetical protein
MNKFVAVAFGLASSACMANEMHVVTFLPPEQMQRIQTSLNSSGPGLWSEAQLAAEGDDKTLIVDVRLAAALGAKDIGRVCQAAAKALSTSLEASTPRKIRIIREWRVIHEC